MENGINGLSEIGRLWQIASAFVVQYSFQILGAVVILGIGWKLADWVGGAAQRLGERTKLDVTLIRFFAGAVRLAILALVVIAALGNFGITVAPLIAAVGAAAFGATVAIQGPLSNFGAGVVIILTRPFLVGNTITVKGVSGVVESINLSDTVLVNDMGDRISVPNRQVNGEIIVNSFAYRAIDTTLNFPGRIKPEAAIAAIEAVLKATPGVAQDRSPQVGINEILDDGVAIGARFWVRNKDFLAVRHAANRGLLTKLEELGLRASAG